MFTATPSRSFSALGNARCPFNDAGLWLSSRYYAEADQGLEHTVHINGNAGLPSLATAWYGNTRVSSLRFAVGKLSN